MRCLFQNVRKGVLEWARPGSSRVAVYATIDVARIENMSNSYPSVTDSYP